MLHKVYGFHCAHLLRKFQTLLISVYRYDIFHAQRSENSNADQADGAAALYYHAAVKPQDIGSFCSLYRMHQNRAGLDQNSGLQIQIAYVEEGASESAAADQNVVGKPSVQMYIVIRKQAIYIGCAHVLLVQVEHGDFRIVFEDHAGNDFIANLDVFSGAVLLDVLAHLDDLAGSFMAQGHRNQSEGISLELMSVGSADTASFYFYQDIVISNLRHRELFDIVVLQRGQHCNVSYLRNISGSCRSCRGSGGTVSCHPCQYLFYNFLNIC